MTPSCPDHPHDDAGRVDQQRSMFDAAFRAAANELRTAEPEIFAVWSLGYLRGVQDRELRHASLDGILAALDDRDGL